tara:strand:+ start:554 stop:976 length:423 start_codon:yes stop_codon:yes gene_type:complete
LTSTSFEFKFSTGSYTSNQFSCRFKKDALEYVSLFSADLTKTVFNANGTPLTLNSKNDAIPFDSTQQEKLIQLIKQCCSSWESSYENSAETMVDGQSWELIFKSGDLDINSSGYEKWPANFDSFVSSLELLTKKVFLVEE